MGEYTDAVVIRRGTRIFNHPIVDEITLESDTLTYDAERDRNASSTPTNSDHAARNRSTSSPRGQLNPTACDNGRNW